MKLRIKFKILVYIKLTIKLLFNTYIKIRYH